MRKNTWLSWNVTLFGLLLAVMTVAEPHDNNQDAEKNPGNKVRPVAEAKQNKQEAGVGSFITKYAFPDGLSGQDVIDSSERRCKTEALALPVCSALNAVTSEVTWWRGFPTYQRLNDHRSGWYGIGLCYYTCPQRRE